MGVIIVSEDVYINAKRINHISIYEENAGPVISDGNDDMDRLFGRKSTLARVKAKAAKKKRDAKKKKEPPPPPPEFIVHVSYTTEDDQYQDLHIRKGSKPAAKKIYKDIVNQIREQCPDKGMMDRLISTHLFGEEPPK